MSLYRDDYQAALARAIALEQELHRLRHQRLTDLNTIESLGRQLSVKQYQTQELAALVKQHQKRNENNWGHNRITQAVAAVVLSIVALLFAHPLGPLAWILTDREIRHFNSGLSNFDCKSLLAVSKLFSVSATVLFVVSTLLYFFAHSSLHS